ncbi:hypothetical protein ABZ464_26315 [Streptomyces sp. NPDC005820]|uniref:hypothetical protein n=1 Tax=Streptomyces sp. NPDC005820 TaxID=3157069 RepID=UPI0033D5309C
MHRTRPRPRPRTRPRRGALTAYAAGIALLATGCSNASPDARTGGCRADGAWTQRERTAWLKAAVTFRGTVDGAASAYADASVVVRAPRTGDVRPLCRPLEAQVQFWTLMGEGHGTELSSVLRYRLDTDGSRTRTVGFPSVLPVGVDGVCAGVLAAVYPGAPLTGAELPESTPEPTGSADADVAFRTERVAAYRLLTPSDPTACATDRPATGPSPTPTGAARWDASHP